MLSPAPARGGCVREPVGPRDKRSLGGDRGGIGPFVPSGLFPFRGTPQKGGPVPRRLSKTVEAPQGLRLVVGQVEKRERVFETAWFARAARKAHVTDEELCSAIPQVMPGQAEDLVGG